MIKKGEIICLETGEYSDRCIVGHFRVARDTSYDEWNAARYRHLNQSGDVCASQLAAELTRLGIIEDIDVREHHADDKMEPED